MMKYLIPLLFALSFLMSFKSDIDKVYICDNKTSSVYHIRKNCKALDKCSHKIITVTTKEAVDKYSKRACKICK